MRVSVAEERRLRAIELRQLLGAPFLTLVRRAAGDRARDLAHDESQEAPVVRIELAQRIETEGQDPGPSLHAEAQDGYRRRLGRREPAGAPGQRFGDKTNKGPFWAGRPPLRAPCGFG